MADLKSLLNDPGVNLADLTAHLDALPHGERVAQSVTLGPKEQRRLWDLAEAGEPLDLDYLVPPDAEPLRPYPFEGRNTLPTFTRFQKVFYRTEDGEIGGYNNQALAWLTGPGYYVAHLDERRPKEIAVDYLQVPTTKPPAWPPIRRNEEGLSRFVYGGMIDYLRWVNADMVIGRAFKGGTDAMPNWFTLCRLEPRD